MGLAPALVVTCALAGCMGSASQAGSDVTNVERAQWKPLLSLDALGQFRTRCAGKRFAVSFTARLADERVDVWLDGVRQGPLTLHPPQTRYTPLRRTRKQVWRIVQRIEPLTIKAVVTIAPARCADGIPATVVRYGTASYNGP
jgi:hypothetical protein